ncbi:MAG: hypothetical protein ACTHPS_05075 [Streptosporangiaceae bacterium]
MITSDVYVRFSPDGPAGVDAGLHLSGSSFIYCHTYPEAPPILSVRNRHVSVRVTVPDSARVTPQDLDTARRLADAVAAYIAELESRMAAQGPAAEDEAA